MQSISELYYTLTKRKYIYNIMPIDNIPSVIDFGIVCFDTMQTFPHISVALEGVQKRRDNVIIPRGKRLHSYANLYFAYDNPMLYRKKNQAEELCILVVSARIMDVNDCIVSDQNAATDLVRFYSPADGLRAIDFDLVFAQYWTHEGDYSREIHHKHVKCAEILVPECVPYDYIVGAYVLNQDSLNKMRSNGFEKKIVVNPKVFYR